jgi:hypothetical protein
MLALAALALAGSGGSPAPAEKNPLAAAENTGDCLSAVWQAQPRPDRAFDRAHDAAEGGSISCATGTSASQFAAALTAVRAAAASGDKAALMAQLSVPLLSIDAHGTRHNYSQAELAGRAFAESFPPEVIALLARARLDDLTVVPDQGAFVSLGTVWLQASRPGGKPRIVTVNLQALGEAKAAARRRKAP